MGTSMYVDNNFGERLKRPQNIYYQYKGDNLIGANISDIRSAIATNQPQLYLKTNNNYKIGAGATLTTNNYDQVFFSSVPNYVYRLNQAYESGSSTSTSDYRMLGNFVTNQHNPVFSGSDNNRRSHQIIGYSESNKKRGSSEGR